MRRRQYLTASAIVVVASAGCSGGTGSDDGGSSGDSGGDDSEGDELSTPSGSVETFYTTLYGEDDIEATNDLYHPESEAPELAPADFEDFGGVESIQSDLQDTEVVEESDGRARVHATVDYTTPAGSATNDDWFALREHNGEWLVSLWLPASVRSDMSEEEAEEAMQNA